MTCHASFSVRGFLQLQAESLALFMSSSDRPPWYVSDPILASISLRDQICQVRSEDTGLRISLYAGYLESQKGVF